MTGPYRHAPSRKPQCPRCQSELKELLIEEWNASRCNSCTGIWVSGITEEDLPALGYHSAARKAVHDGIGDTPRSTAEAIDCPKCLCQLRRSHISWAGIDIDVCDVHGVWFDPGELRAIARAKTSLSEESTNFVHAVLRLFVG